MHPLTGVALSLLPQLIALVAADDGNALALRAGALVERVTGASDPAGACERLLDPVLARTLTIQLAELALTAQGRQTPSIQRVGPLRPSFGEPTHVSAPIAVAPSPSNFLPCLHEVLCLEGGYSDDPRDPGGPTNFGITRAEWADVCKVPIGSITPEDMQRLSLRQAAAVYRKFYWNAMCCEDLAYGVDLMVFQFGVNAGIDASAQVLQEICGVAADGVIGPITLAAARRIAAVALIGRLAARQIGRYRTFAEWDVYGDGWTNRVDNARTVALSMAGAPENATA